MFVCERCHTERQARDFQESQPLQFTGHRYKGRGSCCCGVTSSRHTYYEYMNACELAGELEEAKEQLDKLKIDSPPFPEVYYRDSRDMLDHARLSERERNLLLYCEELEDIIYSVRC